LSEAIDRGITVREIAAVDQPIDVAPETTAAFVGRALRGPLDTPVLVKNFGDFRRRFGDVWTRSSLGPAVRQFFEHGGRQLYVVRVANNARGAMLCLPAEGSAMILRAVDPGSTERVRAAVDFDGIDPADDERFNLTLQRVDPTSGTIVDQEIHSGVSYKSGSPDFVGQQLQDSLIARLEKPYPKHRPEATVADGNRYDPAWVEAVQDGTDGVELSDYDLVGSRTRGAGIFALDQVDDFDVLYLPPPGKGVDAGPAAILAAEMYCRRRGAMLIVDPPAAWRTPDEALAGIRASGYASPNLLSYFPRIRDRSAIDGNAPEARPAGAAIAGLLCKLDRTHGAWQPMDTDGIVLRAPLTPAVSLDEEDADVLVRSGLNVILRGSGGRAQLTGSRTLARGSETHRMFKDLPVRRLCLRIVSTIDAATRWAVFEKPDARLTARIRGQVLTYLECLFDLGAFVSNDFLVECDAGVSQRTDLQRHGITVLLVFHPQGCRAPISLTLHQTVAGCRVASTAFAPVRSICA